MMTRKCPACQRKINITLYSVEPCPKCGCWVKVDVAGNVTRHVPDLIVLPGVSDAQES